MAKAQYKQQMSEAELLNYLDSSIEHWRAVRESPDDDKKDMARFYVDAFQSVRVSVFGHLKQ